MEQSGASDVSKIKPYIVAIDGPAGSGKSSICAKVCARIGWTYINTGALYRAVGLLAKEAGINLDEDLAVANFLESIAIHFRWDGSTQQLWFKERDITPLLDGEEAGRAASKIAKQPLFRASLLPLQRNLTLSAPVGALVDGRDIGTVVFPDADLKIFLTASLEERSKRRLSQLAANTDNAAIKPLLDEIKKTIAGRDEQDAARNVAPLRQAHDAVVLDSSSMSLNQVVDTLVDLLQQRGLLKK
jgi:cytidylate kinase